MTKISNKETLKFGKCNSIECLMDGRTILNFGYHLAILDAEGRKYEFKKLMNPIYGLG